MTIPNRVCGPLVAALCLAACGHPAAAPTAQMPRPAEVRLVPAALPPALTAAPTAQVRVCAPSAGPPRTGETRRILYDFEPIVVEPLPWGPRLADRSPDGVPRAADELRAAVESRQEALAACYRWARWDARDIRGAVTVDGRVDPWGSLAVDTVEAAHRSGRPLEECVRGALGRVRLPGVTPRETAVRFELRFCPSDQPPAARRPPRPEPAPETESAAACLPMRSPLPVDVLVPALPLLAVSDFDAARDRREATARRACERRCAARSGIARRDAKPDETRRVVIHTTTPILVRYADRAQLAATLRWNLGAYRACYVAGRARRGDLEGTATWSLRVGRAGEVAAIDLRASTLADPDVERCLRDALAETVFELPRWSPDDAQDLRLNIPLELRPVEPPPPLPEPLTGRAPAALARGDGRAAMDAYVALLAAEPGHPDTCSRLVGLLHATALAEPWAAGRTEAAIQALREHAGRNPDDPALGGCLGEAGAAVTEWATAPHLRARRGGPNTLHAEAARRYRALLAFTPPLPGLHDVRRVLAYALYELPRDHPDREELPALLTTIVREDPDPAHREEALETAFLVGAQSREPGPTCR